jgi:hypothetical protein
MQKGPPLE